MIKHQSLTECAPDTFQCVQERSSLTLPSAPILPLTCSVAQTGCLSRNREVKICTCFLGTSCGSVKLALFSKHNISLCVQLPTWNVVESGHFTLTFSSVKCQFHPKFSVWIFSLSSQLEAINIRSVGRAGCGETGLGGSQGQQRLFLPLMLHLLNN